MDPRLRSLASEQGDIVAAWQLLAAGWTRAMVDHRVAETGWRLVHPGVYALAHAPLTRRQRWIAATLTAPGSVRSPAGGGACWGFRPFGGSFEIVPRPGRGGRRRLGRVLVFRPPTLEGAPPRHEGIAIATPS